MRDHITSITPHATLDLEIEVWSPDSGPWSIGKWKLESEMYYRLLIKVN